MKKTSPFTDLNEAQVVEVNDALDARSHLKIVHNVIAGGEDAAAAEEARLALDFSDVTDSASLIACYLNLPLNLRCYVDAVIGLTAGEPDFVEITDEEFAERLGKSTKTVQRYRDEFRGWKDHAALVQIREHWRDPDTREAHPHRYKCNITALAVEATLQARLDAGYDFDPERRRKALEDAAENVVKTAPAYAPSKKKKRKVLSDTETFYRELQSASKSLSSAAARSSMVRNPDFDKVYAQIEQIEAQLAAVKAAYGIQTVSTQSTYKESVDMPQPATPDNSSQNPRLDSEERGVVDNLSTKNDSTESITYEKAPSRVFISDDGDLHAPKGSTDEEINAAWAAHEEKKRSGHAWALMENRLKPQGGAQL